MYVAVIGAGNKRRAHQQERECNMKRMMFAAIGLALLSTPTLADNPSQGHPSSFADRQALSPSSLFAAPAPASFAIVPTAVRSRFGPAAQHLRAYPGNTTFPPGVAASREGMAARYSR